MGITRTKINMAIFVTEMVFLAAFAVATAVSDELTFRDMITFDLILIFAGVVTYFIILLRALPWLEEPEASKWDEVRHEKSPAQIHIDDAIRRNDMKALWEMAERALHEKMDIPVPPILRHIVVWDDTGEYAVMALESLRRFRGQYPGDFTPEIVKDIMDAGGSAGLEADEIRRWLEIAHMELEGGALGSARKLCQRILNSDKADDASRERARRIMGLIKGQNVYSNQP